MRESPCPDFLAFDDAIGFKLVSDFRHLGDPECIVACPGGRAYTTTFYGSGQAIGSFALVKESTDPYSLADNFGGDLHKASAVITIPGSLEESRPSSHGIRPLEQEVALAANGCIRNAHLSIKAMRIMLKEFPEGAAGKITLQRFVPDAKIFAVSRMHKNVSRYFYNPNMYHRCPQVLCELEGGAQIMAPGPGLLFNNQYFLMMDDRLDARLHHDFILLPRSSHKPSHSMLSFFQSLVNRRIEIDCERQTFQNGRWLLSFWRGALWRPAVPCSLPPPIASGRRAGNGRSR